MRFIILTLLLISVTSCGYDDRDQGIGELVSIQSPRQLEGIYANLSVDHGEYWNGTENSSLAFRLGKFQWTEQVTAATHMVQIQYISDQEFRIYALNKQGQAMDERIYRLPKDFIFQDGMLQEPDYNRGSVGLVGVKKVTTRMYGLNSKGNLVSVLKRTNKGFILGVPVLNQTYTYDEYTRLR
jgi:hypothetical protein